jgi:glutamate N-acetyltransferase/amino-acid N-acetyltransferase
MQVKGVQLASAAANIRYKDRDDLLLISLSDRANVAATFTQNAFAAAPVKIAKQHLAKGNIRGLLINSGNANAATGVAGEEACLQTCEAAAQVLGVSSKQILPFSTGVIGELLPVSPFVQTLTALKPALSEDGWERASKTILTTDTRAKLETTECSLAGQSITITGIAKGAGMIQPNMATMLAYIATDLDVDDVQLSAICCEAVQRSFNSITVDSDTSTNDACVLIATGESELKYTDLSPSEQADVVNTIEALMQKLAQAIIRDAEGATKFITVNVNGGQSEADCRLVAFAIANSPLVKTALFASDPNWGRLAMAVGKAGVTGLEQDRVSIGINGVRMMNAGQLDPSYTEEKGQCALSPKEISIEVDIGMGDCATVVWTSDLSYEHVKINADYRS